jgi:hypothetical protein
MNPDSSGIGVDVPVCVVVVLESPAIRFPIRFSSAASPSRFGMSSGYPIRAGCGR